MWFLHMGPFARFVFTRTVYGNVQNNDYLPDFHFSFILSGLDKMHLLSTSANAGEVVETCNEHFFKQRSKQL